MSSSEPGPIGGELELAVADLGNEPAPASALPTFGAPHERWFDTGRSALEAVAADILDRGGQGTAWLPAYCCESAVSPFRRRGFEIRFYAVGAQLRAVDADPRPGDTLLFIHYFGHRNRTAIDASAGWRAAGVRVVEDCVQAGLTDAIGSHGDYAVTSLRKLLPVPDGALLASRAAVALEAAPSCERFIVAKLAGKLLRAALVEDSHYLPLFAHAEAHLDDAPPRRMSWLSDRLLRTLDLHAVARRRRVNRSELAEALRHAPRLRGLSTLFGEPDEGEVALGLPVRVPRGQRDALRAHLVAQRIYCAVHWPLGHLPAAAFAAERALADESMTLPIDQRYGPADLARLVGALESFPGDLA